jgi:hypothetical protein
MQPQDEQARNYAIYMETEFHNLETATASLSAHCLRVASDPGAPLSAVWQAELEIILSSIEQIATRLIEAPGAPAALTTVDALANAIGRDCEALVRDIRQGNQAVDPASDFERAAARVPRILARCEEAIPRLETFRRTQYDDLR